MDTMTNATANEALVARCRALAERLGYAWRPWRAGGRDAVRAGGMGLVFRAEVAGAVRAVKVLRPGAANPEWFRQELLLHRRLSDRLDEPRLLRCHSVRTDGPADLWHGVFDCLEAGTLAERRDLPAADRLRAVRDAARGLAALHRQGYVHRDFTPANIFLVRAADGWRGVLGDLGIAAPLAPDGIFPSGTALLRPVGTPGFREPGLACGDVRADVYAAGATLHAVLAGAPPAHPDDVRALPAAALPAEARERFRRLVARCLGDRAQRPDAAALAAELTRLVDAPRRSARWLPAAVTLAGTTALLFGAFVLWTVLDAAGRPPAPPVPTVREAPPRPAPAAAPARPRTAPPAPAQTASRPRPLPPAPGSAAPPAAVVPRGQAAPSPRDRDAALSAALGLLQAGRTDAATDALAGLHRQAPDWEPAAYWLCRVLADPASGRAAEARAAGRRYLDRHPGSGRLRSLVAALDSIARAEASGATRRNMTTQEPPTPRRPDAKKTRIYFGADPSVPGAFAPISSPVNFLSIHRFTHSPIHRFTDSPIHRLPRSRPCAVPTAAA